MTGMDAKVVCPTVTKSEDSMETNVAFESRDELSCIRLAATSSSEDEERREEVVNEDTVATESRDGDDVVDRTKILLPSPSGLSSKASRASPLLDQHLWSSSQLAAPHHRAFHSHGGKGGNDDGSSFNLLSQSFDVLSENEHFLQEVRRTAEASPPPNRATAFRPQASASTPSSAVGTITLPRLDGSAVATDDISPIKMFGVEATAAEHRSSMDPLPFRYPPERYEHHCDWHHPWSSGGPALHSPRHYQILDKHQQDHQAASNAFYILRSCRQAFSQCTFLLPCIRDAPDVCPVNLAQTSAFRRYHSRCNSAMYEYDPQDLVIATRRVKAAICALGGGNLGPAATSPTMARANDSLGNGRRLFWTSADQRQEDGRRYARLPRRFFVNKNGAMSWEVEEHPHVEDRDFGVSIHVDDFGVQQKLHIIPQTASTPKKERSSTANMSARSPDTVKVVSNGTDQPKMKYRCKLCGQPKQNHSCPYVQSVHRDIAVQVFPCISAHAAKEDDEYKNNRSRRRVGEVPAEDVSSPLVSAREKLTGVTAEVTPTSSSETPSSDNIHENRKRTYAEISPEEAGATSSVAKRTVSSIQRTIQTVPVRRDQYRGVTSRNHGSDSSLFCYPHVPLTYAERRRLSDTLFLLSREVPEVTVDCANILKDARETAYWDLAVAELLTQILVVLYCSEFDKRLTGLQRYLHNLGVAC